MSRRVVMIAGARTPFVRAGTVFREHRALDLAVHAVDAVLERTGLAPDSVDELAVGIVLADVRLAHIAREVVFESRLPSSVRALSLADNCITGTSAIMAMHDAIATGRAEVAVAGGAETASTPSPLAIMLSHNRSTSKSVSELRSTSISTWWSMAGKNCSTSHCSTYG